MTPTTVEYGGSYGDSGDGRDGDNYSGIRTCCLHPESGTAADEDVNEFSTELMDTDALNNICAGAEEEGEHSIDENGSGEIFYL